MEILVLEKGKTVSGVVTEVYNYGIFMDLEGGEKAFLPKEYMYINKKKKLTEVFTQGYNISAKVVGKKKDYFVLTQKELKQEKEISKNQDVSSLKPKILKKEKTASNKNNVKSQKKQVEQIKEVVKEEYQKDKKTTSLSDLKKLSTIGNIKISVQKKNSIRKLSDEKKTVKIEQKILLPLPDNFIEDIVENYEKRIKQLEELESKIRKRGWLNEN